MGSDRLLGLCACSLGQAADIAYDQFAHGRECRVLHGWGSTKPNAVTSDHEPARSLGYLCFFHVYNLAIAAVPFIQSQGPIDTIRDYL